MNLAVSLFFTLIVTVLFILVLRPVALAIGLVDNPGGRKQHKDPTPVVGGIAMYFGFIFGAIFLGYITTFSALIMGGALLIGVGAIDDRFDLAPTVRLIAQACAAFIMVYVTDIQISNLGAPLFFTWQLGAFSVPFTILVTLTVINAFNTIDGIDGLSGGVAFIVLSFMAVFSFNSDILGLILLLMAIVSGFLVCNIPIHSNRHAKCFMGDAGSTFLGFSVACLGVLLSQGELSSMSPVTGLWLVAVPIYDVLTSMFRRIFRGKSPFKPDRYHLHHILMDSGLSIKMTLSIILLLTCITATIGLMGEIFILKDGVMFLSWISLGVLYYGQIVFFRGQNLVNVVNKIRSKIIFLRLV